MSETENEVTSATAPLRLPGSPKVTLRGYLRLEEAINALGQQDHPGTWGCLTGWEQMPFRWSKRDKRYVRHELRLVGTRAHLRNVPVDLALTKADRQACTRLYRAVRDTLRAALEDGAMQAHAVHQRTGVLTPIEAPAIWLEQTGPIFFTGRAVLRQPAAPDVIADVVLAAAPFERWLAARAKEGAKTASVAALQAAGALLREHASTHGYELVRDQALELVQTAAGQHGKEVTVLPFKRYAWKAYGAKAGRPPAAEQARFAPHRSELEARLAALFAEKRRA